MLHASTILLQSNILDNQAIIKRYLFVVDEVLKQLQALKIDVAVTTIVKNIPNYTQIELHFYDVIYNSLIDSTTKDNGGASCQI